MENIELGDYLKSKAKSSGDFISIYLQSAFHTIDILIHFFFQKKIEWVAICFLDECFQCHAIWLEKGIDADFVSPSLSNAMALRFAKLNNFENIILAHNHPITSSDISFFKSYGINLNTSYDIKIQQFLKFSERDIEYSTSWMKACEREGFGFVSTVIVESDFHAEGHQNLLNNIEVNKSKSMAKGLESNEIESYVLDPKQKFNFKNLRFKVENRIFKSHVYNGLIGHYGLSDWWNSSFSIEEQDLIADEFNDLFLVCYGSLYFGIFDNQKLRNLFQCRLMEVEKKELGFWNESLPEFLSDLFIGPDKKYLRLGIKTFEKSEELLKNSSSLIDLHAYYSLVINKAYHPKFFSDYTEFALNVCLKQAEISHLVSKLYKENHENNTLPLHIGYMKMAIVNERDKKFEEAIELCKKAHNEGWDGDWQKRIERCKKKLSKQ